MTRPIRQRPKTALCTQQVWDFAFLEQHVPKHTEFWFRYHIDVLGIDEIYLYDLDGSFKDLSIVRELQERGKLFYENFITSVPPLNEVFTLAGYKTWTTHFRTDFGSTALLAQSTAKCWLGTDLSGVDQLKNQHRWVVDVYIICIYIIYIICISYIHIYFSYTSILHPQIEEFVIIRYSEVISVSHGWDMFIFSPSMGTITDLIQDGVRGFAAWIDKLSPNYTAHLVCPLNKLAHGLALPPCQELEPDEVTYLLGVRYGLKESERCPQGRNKKQLEQF